MDVKILQSYINPIRTAVNLGWKAKVLRQTNKDLAKWAAHEFKDLGPTYIKIGQFIASRSDVFGKDVAKQFDKLKDKVEPLSEEQLKDAFISVNESEFVGIEKQPIATASIGQVHRAFILRKNKRRPVILKVKRPNVQDEVENNLDFILSILQWMNKFEVENVSDTIDLVEDFKSSILKEIDFENEARNILLFRKLNKDNELIRIPQVITTLSNEDYITMEYVKSKPLREYSGDKKLLSKKLIKCFIEQLVKTGTIHGDPHTGNMGISTDGRIVLYDFGNVIQISYQDRQYFKELINYLLVGNKSGVISSLEKLKIKITDAELMNKYIDSYSRYIRTLDINEITQLTKITDTEGSVQSNSKTVNKNKNNNNPKMPFKLTGEFFRLVRVFGILEGVCKELDPDFNYTDVLSDFSSEMMWDSDFILYKSTNDLNVLISMMPFWILNLSSHTQLK